MGCLRALRIRRPLSRYQGTRKDATGVWWSFRQGHKNLRQQISLGRRLDDFLIPSPRFLENHGTAANLLALVRVAELHHHPQISLGSVSVECWWLNPHIALSSGKIRLAG